jgi:LEA14-like dessication related protein
MKQQQLRSAIKLIAAVGLTAALFGCETLRSLISVERPEVRVQGAELTALSFDGAQVTVDLAIDNPNPIGISMSGFSYELLIEGDQFLAGESDQAIQIEPNASSELAVPVAFGFRELADTVTSLGDKEEAAYEVNLELRFDLPVLGQVSVPVRVDGSFPVVRIPTLRLSAVHLESVGLTGAELRLEVTVLNPNIFGVSIETLSYDFSVDDTPWADGTTRGAQRIAAREESTILLPFTVRFLSLGRAVRDILLGQNSLEYQFSVDAVIGTDLPLIPRLELPISRSGTVPLRR